MALALDPRYVVEVRAPRVVTPPSMREIYVRRRIVAGLLVVFLAVATCLGIRSLASRGDGAAPVSAVTPTRSSTESMCQVPSCTTTVPTSSSQVTLCGRSPHRSPMAESVIMSPSSSP